MVLGLAEKADIGVLSIRIGDDTGNIYFADFNCSEITMVG
jgi:hypothetical protein